MTESVAEGREPAAAAVVIIVKKTQGSVWRESGRTELCPTAAWLHEQYGPGEYELRLKLGARILTMLKVLARAEGSAPNGNAPNGNAPNKVEEQPASTRTRTAPRGLGTAPPPEPRTPERFGRRGYAYRKLA